jgi:hypothetical protein
MVEVNLRKQTIKSVERRTPRYLSTAQLSAKEFRENPLSVIGDFASENAVDGM